MTVLKLGNFYSSNITHDHCDTSELRTHQTKLSDTCDQSWTRVGHIHGSRWVGSWFFPYLVGRVESGPIVGIIYAGHPGW